MGADSVHQHRSWCRATKNGTSQQISLGFSFPSLPEWWIRIANNSSYTTRFGWKQNPIELGSVWREVPRCFDKTPVCWLNKAHLLGDHDGVFLISNLWLGPNDIQAQPQTCIKVFFQTMFPEQLSTCVLYPISYFLHPQASLHDLCSWRSSNCSWVGAQHRHAASRKSALRFAPRCVPEDGGHTNSMDPTEQLMG